jgi:secreted trypsin-like serine protease
MIKMINVYGCCDFMNDNIYFLINCVNFFPFNIFKIKIFTAAHCIQDKMVLQPRALDSFYAFIGKYDLQADESGATRGTFSSIRMHPDWDANTTRYDADIAVLVLNDQITFGTFVQPACLPTPTTNVFNIRGTIVGYGLTENSDIREDRPKFVKIPSVDLMECLWNSHTFHVAGSNRTFCAGERGKRACKGDSGSGFYVKSGSSTYTVTGIVSNGSPDCDDDQFAVFTSVPKFVDWIRQEMAKEKEMAKDGGAEEQGVGVTLECEFKKDN